MAQQTAVEWLVEELIKRDKDLNPSSFAIQIYFESSRNIVDQAKQMEKEQALGLADEAYEAGRLHEEFCNVFDDPKGRFINSIIK
jgi:hypothetical protein